MHEHLRPVPSREEANGGGNTPVGKQYKKKTPTCLVLEGIKSLLTFYNPGDIISRDADCVINLCLNGSGLGIRPGVSTGSRGIGR